MTDLESLIGKTLPFVKDLLKTYGEFFPVGSGIKADGSYITLKPVNYGKRPSSERLIEDFKQTFIKDTEEYRAITIFYDVLVTNHKTGLKTDAIAIYAEAQKDELSKTYYYPYVLKEEQVVFDSNDWSEEKHREIFML